MYNFESKQWFSYEKSTMWAAKRTFFFFFCKRCSTINLSHRLSLMMRSQSVSLKFGWGFSAYPWIFCTSIRQCCELWVFIHCKLRACKRVMLFSPEKCLPRYPVHSRNLTEGENGEACLLLSSFRWGIDARIIKSSWILKILLIKLHWKKRP